MSTRRRLILGLAALGLSPNAALARPATGRGLGDDPPWAPFGEPLPVPSQAPRCDLGPLQEAMSRGRFIAYHPTASAIWDGVASFADEASIAEDLKVLAPYFDGLITYGARNGSERVADVARAMGFRGVIQGVWNPGDAEETGLAIEAWRRNPGMVLGLSLGNEVVLSGRGHWGDLAGALRRVRNEAPGLPLSTTEPFAQFLNDAAAVPAMREMDFLLANVHPIFQGWFFQAAPDNWAEFVARVNGLLTLRFPGPVIVKETGVPSGPAQSGYSEKMQRDFYRALEAKMPANAVSAFAYFSAFDLPWAAYQSSPVNNRTYAHEAHWGVFTAERDPKLVVNEMAPLKPPAANDPARSDPARSDMGNSAGG